MVSPELIQNLVNQPSAGQRFTEALRGGLTNNLIGSALRGEEGAVEKLSHVNPQAAMVLQKQMQEARLKEAQRRKAEQDIKNAQAELFSKDRKTFQSFNEYLAKRLKVFDTYEEAKPVAVSMLRDFYTSYEDIKGIDLEPLMGPVDDFTEDEFRSIKGMEEPDRLPAENFLTPAGIKSAKRGSPEWDKYVGEGYQRVSTTLQAGSVEELGFEKLLPDLAESEIATRNAIRQGYQLRDLLMEDPDALTLTARGLGLVQAMAHETEAAARVMGFKIPEGLNDASRYAETFEGLGIDNARARSLLTGLAYTAAAAKMNQTGRALSDRDVKNALEVLGAGYVTPEARVAVLDMFLEDIAESFKVRRSVIMGPDAEPYQGDLGIRKTAQPTQFREGQVVRQGGVTYKFTNGEMVAQ